MTTKLISEGCDWLTVTSQSKQSEEELFRIWNRMMDEQDISTRFERKASWEGYIGLRVPHAFIGERKDGTLLQLSGALATAYAKDALLVGGRPSRIDIQVTGVPDAKPGLAIERMFEDARKHKPATGRPPELKMFVGRGGVEGMYVGRRSSEVMLRVYDKGRESKEKFWQGSVRVEAEIKGDMAKRYAGAFCNEYEDRFFYRGTINALCQARGIKVPFDIGPQQVVLHKTSYVTPVEGKMSWLRSQVSGVVQAMIDEVGEAAVASVLFPDQLDQGQRMNELLEQRMLLNRSRQLS